MLLELYLSIVKLMYAKYIFGLVKRCGLFASEKKTIVRKYLIDNANINNGILF